MGVSTVCPGCGQRVQAPEGYKRRRLQCPACGVMCDLPERVEERVPASQSAPRPAPSAGPRPPGEEAPSHSPRAATEMAPEGSAVHVCRVCGERIRVASAADSKLSHCPVCGTAVVLVPPEPPLHQKKKQAKPVPPLRPVVTPPQRPAESAVPAENAPAYEVRDKTRPCPNCECAVPLDVGLCPKCGYNLQTGELPPEKNYERLQRCWETGLTYHTRLKIFIAAECLFVLVGLPGAVLAEELPAFFIALVLYSVPLAFVLGTFDRIDLSRNERGRVLLSKTWRCCFRTWSTTKIPWHDYEGVKIGRARAVDFWDWMIFIILLLLFIVPGVIWYFLVIHQDSFFMALCKDHGYPECMLYRGTNQEFAQDIAATLREVTGLPLES